MLLGNYTALNSNVGRAIGGFTNIYSNYKPGGWYSFYDPDIEDQATRQNSKASFPTGTEPHYSWILAPKGGELSSTTRVNGAGGVSSNAAQGINIAADLSGSGQITTPSLALVTSMIATLAGSGALTGSMVGTVQLAANLAGSGDLAGSLKLIAGLISALSGSGALTADLKGKLSLSADLFVNSGTATVNEMATAVWDVVAADHDTAGTMGEKMNDAGSASNPWSDTTTYGAGTKGKLLQDALSTNKFIGLK